MRGREIDIIDFGHSRPQYVKDTANFKRYDDCNKSLNEYIGHFMRYEQFRNRIRKGIKPARAVPHVGPTHMGEVTRFLSQALSEPL